MTCGALHELPLCRVSGHGVAAELGTSEPLWLTFRERVTGKRQVHRGLSEVSQPLVFCSSGTLGAKGYLCLMMFNCILREVSGQTLGISQHLTQLISCPLLLKRKSCTCSLLCVLSCLSALFGCVLKLFLSLFCLN